MALVWRSDWITQDCGDGKINAAIGYDDATLRVTRVRYENTSTNGTMDFQLWNPSSDFPDGTPKFAGNVPPNTQLTTQNIQGLGLFLKPSRFDATLLVPDGWQLSTQTAG